MSPITVVIILIVVAVILVLGLLLYTIRSLKNMVKDGILCTFITPRNTSYDELRPVQGNLVVAPESHIPLLKKKPKGHYILPDKADMSMTQWPTWGWPTMFRVEVRRAFYVEGNPIPIPMGNAKTLDTARILEVAGWGNSLPKILGKLGQGDGIVPEKGLKSSHFWLGIGCLALFALISCIIAFMTYSSLSDLTSLWGL